MTQKEIEKIVEKLINCKLSGYYISKKTEITETTISNYRQKTTFPTKANAKLLEYFFNEIESADVKNHDNFSKNSNILVPDSDNFTQYGIPLIPIEAVAGLPTIDNIGVSFADCKRYVIPEFEGKGVDYMIRVSGSSMYPKYSNGDILACKYIENVLFLQWGKIYVIDSSQGALVKRVFQDETNPDNLILVSDNKENYPPFTFPKSDIRSLSIVVGVIRLE